jgi:hypothetical protein
LAPPEGWSGHLFASAGTGGERLEQLFQGSGSKRGLCGLAIKEMTAPGRIN